MSQNPVTAKKTVAKRVVKTVVETGTVVLTLPIEYARTLSALAGSVGGDPSASRRKHLDDIGAALDRVRVRGAATPSGSVYFANEEVS